MNRQTRARARASCRAVRREATQGGIRGEAHEVERGAERSSWDAAETGTTEPLPVARMWRRWWWCGAGRAGSEMIKALEIRDETPERGKEGGRGWGAEEGTRGGG